MHPQNVYVDIENLCCGLVFTISLFIQLFHMWKKKSSQDLSLMWLILSIFSTSGGLFYGIWYDLWPIYVATSTQLVATISILISKIILDGNNKHVSNI